jgi:hypothetical protein
MRRERAALHMGGRILNVAGGEKLTNRLSKEQTRHHVTFAATRMGQAGARPIVTASPTINPAVD